jgi:serine/threonine-protein kinase
MDARRWTRVMDIFSEALEKPVGVREDFIHRACAGDGDLAREVNSLVAEHDQDPDFMDRPLARVAEVLDAPPESVEGWAIGRYRVVRPLGQGGMGDVYLAMDERQDVKRPVAIKVIRRGMATDEVLSRFRTEERILATLRHPNIAQLLDGGVTDDGRPFLAMEFVEGRPIDVYCRESRLGVEQRLALFVDVCDAVQHAHRNLVVHRDLKPANILVAEDGKPKLLDFGIGKLLDPAEGPMDATRTGFRLLTPGYASPEQVRGEVVSVASDVYQLGLLLCVLLTGHRPYGEETGSPSEVERAILLQEPARPSTLVGDDGGREGRRRRRRLTGDLDTIVLTALRKDPERRYADVAALAGDIQRHLAGMPIRARADTLRYRAGKFIRRNRLPVATAALIAIALAGTGVYTVLQSRRVAQERDEALEVRNFLLEMFGAVGANQATGDTVTARQLLDLQTEAVEAAYGSRPRLRARMLTALAEGYDRLGQLHEAETLARRALELRLEEAGDEDQLVAESRALLGWILHEGGRTPEGEALEREAIAALRAARPVNEAVLARALNDLGVMREASGAYDEAETLYDEALARRRLLYGGEHRAVAVTASNLSVIRYRKGDYAGAARVGEEALAAMRGALGPDHQRSLVIQSNLAAMRLAMSDVTGAEGEYRDLLERQTRLRGPDDLLTLRLKVALGSTLESQGRWGEAESLLREVLASQEVQLGPEHPEVAATLSRIGRDMSREGRSEDALPLLERALDVLRRTRGENHVSVARAGEYLGEAHTNLGHHETGERLHRDALAAMTAALGPDHPETLDQRLRMGDVLLRVRKPDEALVEFRAAEEGFMRLAEPPDRSLYAAHLHMTQAYLSLGRVADADSVFRLGAARRDRVAALPAMTALQDTLAARLDSIAGR